MLACLVEGIAMRTWADFNIVIPYGMGGEVRTLCPRCSGSRRKSSIACLAVNTDKETWLCHHCGWKGGLCSPLQLSPLPTRPHLPVRPDNRKRAALRRAVLEDGGV